MSSRSIPSMLHDLIHHAVRIRAVYESSGSQERFLSDGLSKDAVLWNFVVIGEVCVRLGDEFQSRHPDLPWRAVIAQRNLIAHGYDILDWNLLIRVIEHDVPDLIRMASAIAAGYGPPPTP
ncbi:MAG TPA: hypothetical protein DEB06_00865 [Phycisphaerales bacterium]|nr:hypothetical protein [Phycisphaerales bacterium]